MTGWYRCENVINEVVGMGLGEEVPKNIYTPEQYEEVLRLRELGYGKRKISKITGIPAPTLYPWYAKGIKPQSIQPLIVSEETRKKLSESKRREKNPNWKGDNVKKAAGNLRARRWFKPPIGKEIHHIDGNPLNNDPLNIMFVTRRKHMVLDGRLNNLKQNRRN